MQRPFVLSAPPPLGLADEERKVGLTGVYDPWEFSISPQVGGSSCLIVIRPLLSQNKAHLRHKCISFPFHPEHGCLPPPLAITLKKSLARLLTSHIIPDP